MKMGLKKMPYTFKLTNNCDNYVKVYITIDSLKEGTTNYILSKYMKGNVSHKGTTDGSSLIIGTQPTKVLENKNNGYVLLEEGLKAKESKEYDLRLWIDYDTTKEQAAGMTYTGQVVVITEPGEEPSLAATILRDNEIKTPLTTPGAEISAYKESDVTITSTFGLCSDEQEYYVTYGTGWEANGTKFNLTGASVTTDTYANSYANLVGKYLPERSIYYSGSSTAGEMVETTNLSYVYYVVSATSSSFTYKTISSNKNQTEALLASAEDDYGTSYYFRGSVTNNYVEFANKCWRIVRIGGDNTVKLILHNDNTTSATSPCSAGNNEETAAFARYSGSTYTGEYNINYDDNAYVGFMYGTPGSSTYEATLANTNKSTILTNLETWYNNNLKTYESVIDDNVFCNDKSISGSGLGYGTNQTYYGTYGRLYTNETPCLKCNGDLSKITSKIGLITADELAFAGYAAGTSGSTSYLQENATGDYWWSLSPLVFDGGSGGAAVCGVYGVFGLLDGNYVLGDGGGRPYISLKSNTNISSGTGTSEDPYKVSIWYRHFFVILVQ